MCDGPCWPYLSGSVPRHCILHVFRLTLGHHQMAHRTVPPPPGNDPHIGPPRMLGNAWVTSISSFVSRWPLLAWMLGENPSNLHDTMRLSLLGSSGAQASLEVRSVDRAPECETGGRVNKPACQLARGRAAALARLWSSKITEKKTSISKLQKGRGWC